jgi:uncharacterized membrane protein YphA (DoxX/SURF4 family)
MDSATTGSRVRRLLFHGDRMGQAPQSRRIRAALCRLGYPVAVFQRGLAAYTEFFGGLLTIFGIGTRLVSIPMIINMLVAILKVNLKSVNNLDDFVELDEPLYALTYLWLLISGPGWVSVDNLISRAFGFNGRAADASSASSKESAVLKHDAATVRSVRL